MDATAPVIFEIGFVLLLAAFAGWLARRLTLPAVLGYLAVGLLVSPFTPGYVAERHQLEVLADVGVVLLLFEVGIEIDPNRLRREARALFLVAPLQTLLTSLVSTIVALFLGLQLTGAMLIGLSVGMSSSVVVVNITRSRRRTTDRSTEEVLLGWSVLQDLVGVTAALVVLVTRGLESRPAWLSVLLAAGFILLAVGADFIWHRVLRVLRAEHDLFLIVPALPWLGILLALILVTKVLVVYVLARLARLPARPSQVAIGLGQVGEFSFVLTSLGMTAGLIPARIFIAVLSAVVVTIAFSTVMVRLAGRRRIQV